MGKTKNPDYLMPSINFLNNAFTAYFCMRELCQVSPQPKFFNDVYTTYLQLRMITLRIWRSTK